MCKHSLIFFLDVHMTSSDDRVTALLNDPLVAMMISKMEDTHVAIAKSNASLILQLYPGIDDADAAKRLFRTIRITQGLSDTRKRNRRRQPELN